MSEHRYGSKGERCILCDLHEATDPGCGCLLCAWRRNVVGGDEPVEQIEGAYFEALADAAHERLGEVSE